jgi:hypothetical protein
MMMSLAIEPRPFTGPGRWSKTDTRAQDRQEKPSATAGEHNPLMLRAVHAHRDALAYRYGED